MLLDYYPLLAHDLRGSGGGNGSRLISPARVLPKIAAGTANWAATLSITATGAAQRSGAGDLAGVLDADATGYRDRALEAARAHRREEADLLVLLAL